MVAHVQQQWAAAERSYQEALQIKIEFNDRYSQALTLHQLGRVAEDQRQWDQAVAYVLPAAAIWASYNDHQLGLALRTLVRLRQAGGQGDIAARLAETLEISMEESEALLARVSNEQ